MSMKTLTLTGVTTAVAILTTVGLNLVAPISLADEAPPKTISVDEVFGGSVSDAPSDLSLSTTAAPIEVAQADTGAATAEDGSDSTQTPPAQSSSGSATAGGSCSMSTAAEGGPVVVAGGGAAAESIEVAQADIEPAPTPEVEAAAPAIEPAAEAAPEIAPAPEPAAAVAEEVVAAEEVAAAEPVEAPVPTPVSAGGACSTGIASGDAPVIVTATGMPGDAPAASVEGAVEPAATDSPAEFSSAPEVVPEPEPAPAPAEVAVVEPVAEPAPAAAPAPKPAPKRVSRPQTSKPKAPPPEVKTAWWPAKTAGKLNITYAGDASFTKAIVLLFDGAFDSADSANQNVVVKTTKGKVVPGQWLVANANRQMLLFNANPGLYTVEVGGGLTDKGGRALAAAATGPVYIP